MPNKIFKEISFENIKVIYQNKNYNPENDRNRHIIMACENSDKDILNFLLNDKRTDPSAQGNLALFIAVENNDLPIIEILMNSNKMSISSNYEDIIWFVSQIKNRDIMFFSILTLLFKNKSIKLFFSYNLKEIYKQYNNYNKIKGF
jgi:hypothetical protein